MTTRFRTLFTLYREFFSTFPHGTCSLSGSRQYLGLEVDDSHLLAQNPVGYTLEKDDFLSRFLYGAFTLFGVPFQGTSSLQIGNHKSFSKTPHLYHVAMVDSVCPVLLSLAGTRNIPIGFFSCGY